MMFDVFSEVYALYLSKKQSCLETINPSSLRHTNEQQFRSSTQSHPKDIPSSRLVLAASVDLQQRACLHVLF